MSDAAAKEHEQTGNGSPSANGIVSQHFVHFLSPGTFMSEETRRPIEAWDVEMAAELAHGVLERYNSSPYGFYFSTRSRGPDDLDSKQSATSSLYYLGGKVETLAEVEARNDPSEHILRSNMRGNGYDRIVINDNSWRFIGPLRDTDVVLDWTPRAVEPAASGQDQ